MRLTIPRRYVGYFFVAPAIIYLLCASIYPILRTLQMSFTDVVMGEWQFVGFQQYREVVQDPWFWNSVKGTLQFTLASTILHLSIGLVFALLLNETWFNTTLRNCMRGLLILPWVFSTAAAGLMWSLLYHPFGLLNYLLVGVLGYPAPIQFLATPGLAMISVILVNTWKSYPFYMIAILGRLQGIPHELYEASKVDGASVWQRFCYVTLPQLRPVLLIISTIDIITTFGHVDLISMLTRGEPLRSTETVAYYIYKRAVLDGNLGYGAAVSIFMLLLLTGFTVFYLRAASRGGETGEASL
jgi:multiple sugar transport system permease protein